MPVPASLLTPDGEIPEYTMVRVRNVGDRDVVFKWNKARYRIPPGADIPVPWPAMVRHMGDPRTVDLPGPDARSKQRTYEFQRLANKYGIYSHHHKWNANIPKVEAYTLEGERIITVLDDPRGTQNNPEVLAAEASVQNELTIKAMQEQMARMAAQLAELTGGDPQTAMSGLPPLPAVGSSATATSANVPPVTTDGQIEPDDDDVTPDSPHTTPRKINTPN